MKYFRLYEENQVDTESAVNLKELKQGLNFIPNVYAAIAASAPALCAFMELNSQFSRTQFSDTERQIILLATSTENRCGYCVAGHTTFSAMQGVSAEHVNAMRDFKMLSDKKLETLNQFTRALVRDRGRISDQLIEEFLSAGYTQTHAIEIILGISIKTFSNLTSILMDIPLDKAFKENTWSSK